MLNIKTGLKSGLVHEVRFFRYVVGGRTMAEIEVLIFNDPDFTCMGSQAKVTANGVEKWVSSGKSFKNVDEALNDAVALVEREIAGDEWVSRCERFAGKERKKKGGDDDGFGGSETGASASDVAD